jgi:hypothetical protein
MISAISILQQNQARLTQGGSAAAQKYHQGFHFVNCGADIVAITAWMGTAMTTLSQLTSQPTKAGSGESNGIKGSKKDGLENKASVDHVNGNGQQLEYN